VSGGKIGNGGSMQRERCAEQGGDAALGRRKVAQPDCLQLERNLAWRGSFRLLRGAAAIASPENPRKSAAQDDATSPADAAASAGQKNAEYGN
jgi:hypothetical protein